MTFSVGLSVPGRRPAGGGAGGYGGPPSSSSSSSSATDWLPVKAWGEVADAARGRVHRGTLLVVSGTLRTEPEAPPPQQQQQQAGEDGGYQQQQPRGARAYIHAKSIGIVTRRPSSAADALGAMGGGDAAAAAMMQQQQQQPSPEFPQQQQQYQQQQQQQYAPPATPQPAAAHHAATHASSPPPPPPDRAAACELLWRDWAQQGADGWFDNRARKRSGQGNARQPDFRRKGGAPASFAGTPFEKLDALWIDSPTTPAWVMERL
jgi:single-stranded DNA-binding protein